MFKHCVANNVGKIKVRKETKLLMLGWEKKRTRR